MVAALDILELKRARYIQSTRPDYICISAVIYRKTCRVGAKTVIRALVDRKPTFRLSRTPRVYLDV